MPIFRWHLAMWGLELHLHIVQNTYELYGHLKAVNRILSTGTAQDWHPIKICIFSLLLCAPNEFPTQEESTSRYFQWNPAFRWLVF